MPALILLAAIYLLASAAGWLNSVIIPDAFALTRAFARSIQSGELPYAAGVSLARIAAGFSITLLSALAFCAAGYFAPRAARFYEGALLAMRFVPPLSLVGLLILLLGIGEASKIAIIVLASFFPVYLALKAALAAPDHRLVEMARSFGYSRSRIFWRIIIPAGWPQIFAGLNIGFGYAFRAIVAAEMIAASSGLGWLINDAFMMFAPDRLFVGIISICALSWLCERVFRLLGGCFASA